MKNSFMLLFLIIVSISINAQTIVPILENEYCPNTEYTFTVNVPGEYKDINTSGGCIITQYPYNINTSNGIVTFNFKGKFNDVNQTQSFDVKYGGNIIYQFKFKKVKSLFSGSCESIPQTTVTAQLCQITDVPFSFTALKWKNNSENPELCFGSINTYEYILPDGWKLNGTPSNGNNWIVGNNSVMLTPDATTGGVIQVRAINGVWGLM